MSIMGSPELVDTGNFWLDSPTGEDRSEAVRLVANEFSPFKVGDFGGKLQASLEANGDQVAFTPEVTPRGAEIFRLRTDTDAHEVVAIGITKYYKWDLIKNQLSFRTKKDEEGKLQSISLARFADIAKERLNSEKDFALAAELAYNLVDARYRGQKLGSKMFDMRLARINAIATAGPKFVFTMARGNHLENGVGKQVLDYALQKERETNGQTSDGKAIIKGLEIPISELREQLGLPEDIELDAVHPDSIATTRLAQKAGLQEFGLFKDLTPIYATQVG